MSQYSSKIIQTKVKTSLAIQIANMGTFISIITMFQEMKCSREHEGGIQRQHELQTHMKQSNMTILGL